MHKPDGIEISSRKEVSAGMVIEEAAGRRDVEFGEEETAN